MTDRITMPCPKCGIRSLESNYGGERGEAGPFLRCTTMDCDYDEEVEGRREAARQKRVMAHPTLGPPRIFVEVVRPVVGGAGSMVHVRKEISLDMWRDAKSNWLIAEHEIEAALKEADSYGR